MTDTERLDGLEAGMRRVATVGQILAVECTEDRDGLAHDLAEAAAGIAVTATTLYWGWPWFVAGLLASPGLALVKLVKHRVEYPERSAGALLKEGAWEAMIFASGWLVLLGTWYLTLPAALAWWLILTFVRRLTMWGGP